MQSRINNVNADHLACEKAGEEKLRPDLLSPLSVSPLPPALIDQDLRISRLNKTARLYTDNKPPVDPRSLLIRRIAALRDICSKRHFSRELFCDDRAFAEVRVAKTVSLSSMPLFGKAHSLALSIKGADNGPAAAKSDVIYTYNITQKTNSTIKMAECVPIHELSRSRGEGRC